MERDEDVGRLDVVLGSDLLDNFVVEEGRVVRSERRVCGYCDPLRNREIDDILLGARAMWISLDKFVDVDVMTNGWSSIWFTAGTTLADASRRSRNSTEKLETPKKTMSLG